VGPLPHNPRMLSPLISAGELRQRLDRGDRLRVIDCSFDLTDPSAGRRLFESEHLPGAVHADLDLDLSDKSRGPTEGRHPLPARETFAARAAAWGIGDDTEVVVMDRAGIAFAGRLWWMLRWCGHAAVTILDGGLAAWKAAGGPVATGPAHPPKRAPEPARFTLRPALEQAIDTAGLLARVGQPGLALIDARAAARFRGEVEPLDPVAGHIPGALNRPFGDNLLPDGRFKPAEVLRAEFTALLAGRDPATVVHQCGSGVSAIPNLVAMAIAGLDRGTLYPGSWSAWCHTPGTPRARG